MLGLFVQFFLCAFVIIIAGSFLARFADAIAEITKLGRLIVGTVLLAGATSLPELTVDISAVRMNMPDLAVGDLLGSCLMNLLILGVLDLSHYSRGKMFSKLGAAHALSGSMCAAMTALVAMGLLTGKALEKYSLFHLSPFSFLIAIAYGFGIRLNYLDQRISAAEQDKEEKAEDLIPANLTLKKAVGGFAICALAILIAGPFLASSAGEIAELSGLGKTFVGTTMVALCTSLPELASSIAALRMGAWELAIGNIFGSNVFNLLMLIPLDLLLPEPLFATVSVNHAVTCMAVIIATMIIIAGQIYRVEARVFLLDPDAWLVIITVFGGLALIYYLPH